MKKSIHPMSQEVEYTLSDGEKIYINLHTNDKKKKWKESDLKQKSNILKHPAWTGTMHGHLEETDKLATYRKKWGSSSIEDVVNDSTNAE